MLLYSQCLRLAMDGMFQKLTSCGCGVSLVAGESKHREGGLPRGNSQAGGLANVSGTSRILQTHNFPQVCLQRPEFGGAVHPMCLCR